MKAVKPSPFICKPEPAFSFPLSTTEATVDCLFILLLLPYPTPLSTVATIHFRIKDREVIYVVTEPLKRITKETNHA
uniref:Uncharacterized protein n=1 Tax=Romanomermis culicivorax TaxID=13658 RepID=A0A915HDC5_ROMCU